MSEVDVAVTSEPVAPPSVESAPAPEPIVHAVEKTAPVVAEKPKSMEDTLRAKYRELGSPKSNSDVIIGEQPRGPDGKFAPKVTEAASAEEQFGEEAVVEAPAVEEKPPVDPALEKAPSSWRKEAQAKWTELPPDIKSEVMRREQDFHKGIEGYKQMANIGQLLDAEIRPYEPLIRAAGTTPQAAIRDFFNTAYIMKTGSPEQKAQTLLDIAHEYGVDMEAVATVSERIAQGQPPVNPEVQELKQQLNQLSQSLQQREQAAAQQEFAGVVDETQKFARTKGHENYEAVKLDMAALIENGRAEGLQDAYDKAIWAHPEVRAKLLAQQEADKRKQAAEKAAAAKRAASTNVVSRGTLPSAPVVGTMEDTIRQTYHKIQGR